MTRISAGPTSVAFSNASATHAGTPWPRTFARRYMSVTRTSAVVILRASSPHWRIHAPRRPTKAPDQRLCPLLEDVALDAVDIAGRYDLTFHARSFASQSSRRCAWFSWLHLVSEETCSAA